MAANWSRIMSALLMSGTGPSLAPCFATSATTCAASSRDLAVGPFSITFSTGPHSGSSFTTFLRVSTVSHSCRRHPTASVSAVLLSRPRRLSTLGMALAAATCSRSSSSVESACSTPAAGADSGGLGGGAEHPRVVPRARRHPLALHARRSGGGGVEVPRPGQRAQHHGPPAAVEGHAPLLHRLPGEVQHPGHVVLHPPRAHERPPRARPTRHADPGHLVDELLRELGALLLAVEELGPYRLGEGVLPRRDRGPEHVAAHAPRPARHLCVL
mmetsp:Transcript_24204/g.82674  ORF Transcript_24204/g.82674 Transcript_24204/m.82674 type:complete len:271 (-) Transcript_24204:727-1539(-)